MGRGTEPRAPIHVPLSPAATPPVLERLAARWGATLETAGPIEAELWEALLHDLSRLGPLDRLDGWPGELRQYVNKLEIGGARELPTQAERRRRVAAVYTRAARDLDELAGVR